MADFFAWVNTQYTTRTYAHRLPRAQDAVSWPIYIAYSALFSAFLITKVIGSRTERRCCAALGFPTFESPREVTMPMIRPRICLTVLRDGSINKPHTHCGLSNSLLGSHTYPGRTKLSTYAFLLCALRQPEISYSRGQNLIEDGHQF